MKLFSDIIHILHQPLNFRQRLTFLQWRGHKREDLFSNSKQLYNHLNFFLLFFLFFHLVCFWFDYGICKRWNLVLFINKSHSTIKVDFPQCDPANQISYGCSVMGTSCYTLTVKCTEKYYLYQVHINLLTGSRYTLFFPYRRAA